MASAYKRYRRIEYLPTMTLRVDVPHSWFMWLSALNCKWGVRTVGGGDDIQYTNWQDLGQGISDYDRRLLTFTSDKEYSQGQARALLDMAELIFDLAWDYRDTLTIEQVRDLSLFYPYDRLDENNKKHYRHYEVTFMNQKLIGNEFVEWETTRGNYSDVERIMARMFRKIPLLIYTYIQDGRQWPVGGD